MIAVLSCRFGATVEWLMNTKRLEIISKSGRIMTDEFGKKYMIITNEQQAYGIYFESYIRAPDFYTLEDVVKTRILPSKDYIDVTEHKSLENKDDSQR
jgi:hypothetical protein